MPWPVHPTGFFGARGDQDTYKIERSLRFNSADSAYLNRTPASAGNRKTWTWSGWVKRSDIGSASRGLFVTNTTVETNGSTYFMFLGGTNSLYFATYESGVTKIWETTQVFRDPSAWYHVLLVFDTTQATATNRVKIYINGSQIISFSTQNTISQNYDSSVNDTVVHEIGNIRNSLGTRGSFFDGYLTEINFIDGQALTPSSFGETDAITGRWKAKAYSGTYGTNGFYLKFADNSGTTDTTLGKDLSGNGNNWTPNNFSVTAGADNDSLFDSPTNNGTSGNYCTINQFLFRDESSGGYVSGSSYISDGNLKLANGSTSYYYHGGSIGVKSGKWYFEAVVNGVEPTFGNFPEVGFVHIKDGSYRGSGFDPMSITMKSDTFYGNLGTTYVANDIVRIAIDIDSGKIWFGKNNSWLNSGDPSTGSNGITTPSITGYVFPSIAIYGTSSITSNFGQRPFAYTAPTGFKALCTTNLPQPTIQKPSKYMDVVAYTGTGASNSISSLGFSPDLVWIKNRGGATDHALYDTTRGTQAQLSSNTTGSEVTSSTGLTAFGTNGFTIGTSSLVNTSGTQYVAWAWDEAPIAGMDIVSYTGNGTTQNVSHSLGVTPKMVIVKNRDTAATPWNVYHSGLTAGNLLSLNQTSSQFANTNRITAVSSSNFSVGSDSDVNQSTKNHIAYLFAEVEGFSKFGSYTGNGSADGPFVWCGFRPRWVLCKGSSVVSNWVIYDTQRNTFNVVNNNLYPALASAEDTSAADIDILSNGFKFREGSALNPNTSGDTYIFAAFAESPFKYARAR